MNEQERLNAILNVMDRIIQAHGAGHKFDRELEALAKEALAILGIKTSGGAKSKSS
jgi:hypothetical protein